MVYYIVSKAIAVYYQNKKIIVFVLLGGVNQAKWSEEITISVYVAMFLIFSY